MTGGDRKTCEGYRGRQPPTNIKRRSADGLPIGGAHYREHLRFQGTSKLIGSPSTIRASKTMSSASSTDSATMGQGGVSWTTFWHRSDSWANQASVSRSSHSDPVTGRASCA